jgi:hypothetical protein
MEIMLQWLDDLEDLVFALPLIWERLRLPLLNVGLLAAGGLHAEAFWSVASWWVPTCVGVAATIALGWFTALLGSQVRTATLSHTQ